MSRNSLFPNLVRLCDLVDKQEADFFALMFQRESLTTRDGKPYVRVGFRDATREVSFPVWNDSPWSKACSDWEVGQYYKIRATYRETAYGPQLDLTKIRAVADSDRKDGFDPADFKPSTRFDRVRMFDELLAVAEEHIDDPPLRSLVTGILNEHRDRLLTLPAASRNHHAYVGGWLEHVLSVARNCVFLADKYHKHFPDLRPPLRTDLVVAGGILHDIGKLRELQENAFGAEYTADGHLIGHILQGRDLVREAAAGSDIAPDLLLRLEHIIVSHQRLPEWGSPKPPMTPEALLVHYADDIDAKFQMMVAAIEDDATPGPFTTNRNPLRQSIYKG